MKTPNNNHSTNEFFSNLRETYLEQVINNNEILQYQGMMVVPGLLALPFLEVYVPLKVTVPLSDYLFTYLAQRGWARLATELITGAVDDESIRNEIKEGLKQLAATIDRPREDALKMAKENQRLIILGDPGSGKTSFIRYLALLFAMPLEKAFELRGFRHNLLPIQFPISAFAEARRENKHLQLAQYIPSYLAESMQLADLETYISRELQAGKCMLLLDGLDTVIDATERKDVVTAVKAFSDGFPNNHFVITSRIEGYKEAPLDGFTHCTATDLEMLEIKDFVYNWTMQCAIKFQNTPERREWANFQAFGLAEAIETVPSVRRLAGNPLLLTIIALAYQHGAALPSHRIELYDTCARTLVENWHTTRVKQNKLQMLPMDRTEAIRNFAPLALWMHETKKGGTIRSQELLDKLAEFLIQRNNPEGDARIAAQDFLDMEKTGAGILVQRGIDGYGFSHLTIQEYFAAREIAHKERDAILGELKKHLHDPRWQEVILLTVGQVGVREIREESVTYLVKGIAQANSPYEKILRRDLLMAGRCIADDVGVGYRDRQQILEDLIALWHKPTYSFLRDQVTEVLTSMRGTVSERQVVNGWLSDLSSAQDEIREAASDALGRMGIISENVLRALVDVLQEDKDARVRTQAAIAISRLKAAPEFVINALYNSVDADENLEVKIRAAEALANIGRADKLATELLVTNLNHPEGNIRSLAAKALKSVAPPPGLTSILLQSLRDDPRLDVRGYVSEILGRIGKHSPSVVEGLLDVLNDPRPLVKSSAIDAIGEMGVTKEQVIRPLLDCLEDSDYGVRDRASAALSKLAPSSSYVRQELEERTRRADQTRLWAAEALGRAGLDVDPTIIREEDLRTGEWRDRLQAIGAMKSVDRQGINNQMVIDALAEILAKEPRMSWNFLADGASMMLSEVAKLSADALGNVTRLLQNNSWVVKMVTAKALGLTGKPEDFVLQALIQILQHDPDDHAQGNAATSLGILATQDEAIYERYHFEVVNMLLEALKNNSSYVRVAAAQAIGSLGIRRRDEVIQTLANYLEDQESSEYHGKMVRDAVFEAIWKLAPYSATKS